jgi:hypothetical protein
MDFGPFRIDNESLEAPQKTIGKDSPDNVRADGFLTPRTTDLLRRSNHAQQDKTSRAKETQAVASP